ncbi:hypothetical protein HHK36_019657 [Tetracentron sinense]|uniref:VQ domain-containing protein n=1 Tax=Tetracentron sinense TaxID=13715 RepID=A0A834Z2K2_TETSI|nr:hypothetical protein HHK36_019657 [Tetracentron sinense]
MDKLSVHHRNDTKKAISKKKPFKVVYISNPMKVTTSASKFRALVQELTGKDSNLADAAAKFSEFDASQTVPDQEMKVTDDHVLEVPWVEPSLESPGTSNESSFEPFESFDDIFTTQMLENFVGWSS